jgi:arsenate reductase-like glutaredoxin family protein
LVRQLVPDAVERNYAKEPLSAADVRTIVRAAGSVAAVLNARHAVAKARGWKENPPSAAAFAAAAAEEPNLLRRPIVVRDARAVVGGNLDAIRALLE